MQIKIQRPSFPEKSVACLLLFAPLYPEVIAKPGTQLSRPSRYRLFFVVYFVHLVLTTKGSADRHSKGKYALPVENYLIASEYLSLDYNIIMVVVITICVKVIRITLCIKSYINYAYILSSKFT